MKRLIIFTLIFSSILMTACKIFKKDNTDLPKKPKQIEIVWEQNRGMIGGYESIYLSNDSCAYKIRQKGQEQVVNFTIPQVDLLHLYESFVNNKFSKIQSEKRHVYDRGGSKITLNVDGISKSVNNSGMYFVKDDYLKNFKNIEKEIDLITFKEIDKLKKDVIINLSNELLNSPYYLYLYVNDEEVYSELNEGNFSPLNKKLFEQNNMFKVTLMEKGQTYNTIKGNYEVMVEKLPESGKITLSLVDNNLTIK